jgi:hypothetical protein
MPARAGDAPTDLHCVAAIAPYDVVGGGATIFSAQARTQTRTMHRDVLSDNRQTSRNIGSQATAHG